ncbi:MAG TPA: NADPH:quinone oxidoreductase family protein [Burkholderiales bacterium]|nr:NADPH:quinone oxidoreductase family protein [Burkholderiales bacterium]
MRAVLCKAYGGPSDLVIEDVASLQPGAGEVLVSVRAAGVNFPDALMIQNKYQHRPPLPFSPGYELSGVIKALAPDVTGLKIGDAGVAMLRYGAFAEEALVPADRFWRIPSDIDFVSAAAFPLAYGTSYHALKDRGHLQPGETLMVLGASGGVGLAAVQLGKLMGATVIACASSDEKLAMCKQHGADMLINYRKQNVREAVKALTQDRGIDVILDPVGGEYAEPAVRSMAYFGRYLVVGFTSGEIQRLPMNLPLLKGCSLIGVTWDTYSRRDPAAGQRNISDLIAWICQRKLKPVVTAQYSLDETPRALEDVMQRRVQGKVVIKL